MQIVSIVAVIIADIVHFLSVREFFFCGTCCDYPHITVMLPQLNGDPRLVNRVYADSSNDVAGVANWTSRARS